MPPDEGSLIDVLLAPWPDLKGAHPALNAEDTIERMRTQAHAAAALDPAGATKDSAGHRAAIGLVIAVVNYELLVRLDVRVLEAAHALLLELGLEDDDFLGWRPH